MQQQISKAPGKSLSITPPPIVEILPISTFSMFPNPSGQPVQQTPIEKDFQTFGIKLCYVGPSNCLDLIIRMFPAMEANEYCKTNGFVVSKNCTILKLKRAVQGNNLCMRCTLRIKENTNKFRIRFFTKEMSIIGEHLVYVERVPCPNFGAFFSHLDSLIENASENDLPLKVSKPLLLQCILDFGTARANKQTITFDQDFWSSKLNQFWNLKQLWSCVKQYQFF